MRTNKLPILLFIFLTFVSGFAQNRFSLVLNDQNSLQSLFDALTEANVLCYGSYGGDGPEWSISVNDISVDFVDEIDHNFELSVSITLFQEFKWLNGIFKSNWDLGGSLEVNLCSEYDDMTKQFSLFMDVVDYDINDFSDEIEEWTQAISSRSLTSLNLIEFYPDLDPRYFNDVDISISNDNLYISIYLNEELTVANRSTNNPTGHLTGTLSLENLTTPLLSKSSLSSPSSILARLNDQHIVKTHNRQIGDEYHWNWTNDVDHKLTTDQFQMVDVYFEDGLTAWFKEKDQITISSSIGAINLDYHDPWYYDESTQTQPDCFQPITPGQYQVFLNQNDQFNDQYPIYRLKAPAVYATTSDIMVFDRWQSPSVSAAVFNEQGATTTTNRETDVVFKSANATVTAHYVSANASDINILISAGETVQIPAGGHYISQFDPNKQSHFGFSVFGSLTISGTAANPVTFETADNNIWEGIKVYPRSPASQVNLNHCIIKDAAHIIEIREDPGTVVIDLKKCVIADS